MEVVDVAIVGGGPAGSSCAAFCAAAGLRVAVIEREKFPREKVCGDCINPACLPILERLGLAREIEDLPHAVIDAVDFIAINGRTVRATLAGARMTAIKRSVFDDRLLTRARELGAQVHQESTVVAIHQTPRNDWKIDIVRDTILARVLIGADGRNSTVARLCNLLPRPERERIALQAHIPLPRDFGNRIVLQFLPEGYSGQAPVNETELDLCLVGTAPTIASLRSWAETEFKLPSGQQWRTITPLTRAPIPSAQDNLFLIGDAARVVEPFTGEGIYYALRSGELAANAIARIFHGVDRQSAARQFARDHRAMYRGRLWINQLARHAVLQSRIASRLIAITPISAPVLRWLTRKIVGSIRS
ncbi:MAG TPA: NAD(P)/FAD-dependent oxidoreductase [Chthoniobacterales bacterium]|nr:NAD(P)/FAD-dependent oxidoreductase [Chthoniobacterales bacterium]